MAISDTKKDLLLGQSVAVTVKNIDDNFTTLFDNEADLETQISGKEPAFSKNTAFNKPFSTTAPLMDGTASVGTSATVSRGDHKHPTDTSRLAVNPDGTHNLLDSNNKIQSVYLPDSILGQLEYKGTFNASTATSGIALNKGNYYICSTGGSKNPDGTAASSGYLVGDWAVYNGSADGWSKVDNTDAVTMVNGQIGSVKTYRGAWSNSIVYYSGDTVSYTDGCLYLYINSTSGAGRAPTDTAYWKIYGKVYAVATQSADGLMPAGDKIKLDGVATGAEVNQNAFSKVKVGGISFSARSKEDTITFKAGANVGLTVTTGESDGTRIINISATDTTYSTASTTSNGLMSSDDKVKLNGIASGAEVNQNAFSKVKVGTTTVSSNNKTDTVELVAGNSNVTLSADASTKKVTITTKDTTYSDASTTTSGLMSASDKSKLDGIADGAEVNQNAFSNVKVGNTTVSAESKKDTLELVAGSNVTLTPDATNDKITISAKDTTYGVATESANGLMSSTDKAKLNDIDSSLLGVTADDIGKVKDVKVNGTSVLNTTTGIASITIQALKTGFISVSTGDSVWADYNLNGTVYKAIRVEKTDATLGVFNSSNQQIVVQEAYDQDYLYLCVGTAAINCTLRKLGGGSVTGGGSSGKYLHSVSVSGQSGGGTQYGIGCIHFTIVTEDATEYDSNTVKTPLQNAGYTSTSNMLACTGMGNATSSGGNGTIIARSCYFVNGEFYVQGITSSEFGATALNKNATYRIAGGHAQTMVVDTVFPL